MCNLEIPQENQQSKWLVKVGKLNTSLTRMKGSSEKESPYQSTLEAEEGGGEHCKRSRRGAPTRPLYPFVPKVNYLHNANKEFPINIAIVLLNIKFQNQRSPSILDPRIEEPIGNLDSIKNLMNPDKSIRII